MKHVFLHGVMILSLLAAVGGCTLEIKQSQITNVENGQEQGQKPDGKQGQAETGDSEKEAGSSGRGKGHERDKGSKKDKEKEGETQNFVLEDGGGETGTTEIEVPLEMPPVVIPPVAVQPVITLPVVPPAVIVKPVIVRPVIVPPDDAPYEGGGETPVVVVPITVPPVVAPPREGEGEAQNLLMLNELRTEFAGLGKRAEYIEFKATAAGNLKGLSLHIMYDAGKPFVYNFPAVTVASGEYITLHLQTFESVCIDELGENLSLSGGNESCPTARDLWVSGTAEVLHKTDIVYLQGANGKIIDAVVMNEKPGAAWNSNQAHFAGIVDTLRQCGMWRSADAVNTSAIIGTSYSQSVSRDEDMENTHSADDWYITGIGGITPGKANQ